MSHPARPGTADRPRLISPLPSSGPPDSGPLDSGSLDSGSLDSGDYRIVTAPYALVRATVLRHPAQSPPAAAFRARVARLTGVTVAATALLPALGDALHDSRPGHSPVFHREVVLPLRRALHNGREVRPALLARLGDLPERVPLLAAWLDLHRERALLLDELTSPEQPLTPAALAAERAALASLCRHPALGRAVSLTSAELLRAIQRTATGATDRRARKDEAGVLRYALRAATKTSPLSWFTAVGWGLLTGPAGRPAHVEQDFFDGPLTSVVRANRTLVTALVNALTEHPGRRAHLPHRITSTARRTDGRAAYVRDGAVFAGGRYLVPTDEEIEVADTEALRLVGELAAWGTGLGELADHLGGARALRYLDQLTTAGLLLPVPPVTPQETDPLPRLADWLRSRPEDTEPAENAELADRIDQLDHDTTKFADTPAAARPAALADLAEQWRTTLTLAGHPDPTTPVPFNVLSEDVVSPGPLPLAGLLDTTDHRVLAETTALAELFDLGHLVRRAALARFLARYGPGGVCRHPWEFGTEITAAWEQAGQLTVATPGDGLPPGLAEFIALREQVRAALPAATRAAEVVLPADLVQGLGARLPAWVRERPLGYAYFLQRDAAGLLCLNHLYGGWGRFTSRFLDTLPPEAGPAIRAELDRHLPGAVQLRPVGGFNANLHPRLTTEELGTHPGQVTLGEHELELVHDLPTDQLRLRRTATGELLDLLYSGFLAPIMLPCRIAAHLSDHPEGVVDFRPLLPHHPIEAPGGRAFHTPRLRHRHLVLLRRRWHLPPGVTEALRAELAADHQVPAATAARWRALLDLPEQLFLHPATAAPVGRPAEDFLIQLGRPKPQFLDLGNALHLRCLARWLARHPEGVILEEALPAPAAQHRPTQAVEFVIETHRPGRQP
ncbi:Putative Lantibiotic dehydratase domain-containing protein [Kitasatospora sp. MMS16-BH015]|uniref:lantibiotic dehydratase n=1 Tax=Kitasatospora sp. MMS16-BH015 TaxID=2018025 RepID=UPI000CA34636|nr:lantibiotic dehydratase [Kitasatospora sp. MMS16-BH015]AUG81083.1 Putative Lantibiotic dehydratase domain-containing protein [Kitasatospora sp. MMS16-BH015]